MYPLFVATAVVLAAGTHHRVVSAGGMQLKHRSSVRVHGASRRAAIPHGLGNPTFCMGFNSESAATSPDHHLPWRMGAVLVFSDSVWPLHLFIYLSSLHDT